MNFKRFLSSLITFCIVCTSTFSRADDAIFPQVTTPVGEKDPGAAISPMKKGQTAPFTGVLLSPKATATIITQVASQPAQIQIEIDKARGVILAQCNFQLDEQKNILETDKKVLQTSLDAKMKELNVLDEQLKKERESRPSPLLWAGLGFGSGIALTIVTALVVTKVTTKQ